MALILRGLTKCSMCGGVIESDDETVSTTHFIDDQNDALWRFSDSAMHKQCFLNWEHRKDFIKKFNESRGIIIWGNGTRHHMEDDGNISVLKVDN